MTSSPQLPGIFQALGPALDHYGYLAVGGFVMLEDFGVPVPGETMLVAAAVYAGAGRLNIVAVAVIALVAAVVGDNIGFAIGHFGGRELALRWGRYVFLTPERLHRAEEFFARHGGKVVTVARFIEGLRQLNGIIAGISEMSWRRFAVFNALGAALWVAVWTTVGYTAGTHLEALYRQLVRYELYLGIVVGVLVAAYVAHRIWTRRRRARDRGPSRGEEEGGAGNGAGTSEERPGNGGSAAPGPPDDRGRQHGDDGEGNQDPGHRPGPGQAGGDGEDHQHAHEQLGGVADQELPPEAPEGAHRPGDDPAGRAARRGRHGPASSG
ncbi:MAG TPA: VTT domain-containing protein [Acidimicrobiales bacterium]|jgi:membrane protein DedA with SNARE-associated domain|nr:VTT domain-containing protein [Acidimicrobiales bacterium]